MTVAAVEGSEVPLDGRRGTSDDGTVRVLLDDLHLTGILQGERRITTGVLYGEDSRASSWTELIAAEEPPEGPMRHLASAPLGGPLRLEGIRYEGEDIVLHLLDFGPQDPPCCPSLQSDLRFRLEGDSLVHVE